MDYKDAGVDIRAGRAFVDQIRSLVSKTHRPEVIGGLGGFGGLFQLPTGYSAPILVSGTDGVGTKLKIAQMMDNHQTVGIDLVAMCVNDVLTCGAEPLFFLDYLATGELKPEALVDVVAGIAQGCQSAGCALLGGETAEMPGFYQSGEYDLAGFCVGIVDQPQLLDGSQVKIGDVAIGLASSGVHSNGFSLVRKIISDRQLDLHQPMTEFTGQTLGQVLLTPTYIYVKPVLAARQAGLEIHGMAHITGGGLPENLPRCLGQGQSVQVDINAWPRLPVFGWIATTGQVSPAAMFDTFNMGIGFVVIVPPQQVEATQKWFSEQAIANYVIGKVVAGTGTLIGLPD
jgi:phosphoribosylformylglycinamidine cyclo-ligase